MIIRRIAESLRRQDWVTVAIELAIVVAGIFIGLQVDDWNQSRKDSEKERQILVELHADFIGNATSLSLMADRHDQMAEELGHALDILTRGELAKKDATRFRNAVVSMYQLPSAVANMSTFDMLVASGDISLLSDRKLRTLLANFAANLNSEASLVSYFRQSSVSHGELTRDVILLIPNSDRTDLNLRIDFDTLKDDYRMTTIVAGQQRIHRIIGEFRRSLSENCEEIAAHIESLVDIRAQPSDAAPVSNSADTSSSS